MAREETGRQVTIPSPHKREGIKDLTEQVGGSLTAQKAAGSRPPPEAAA